MNRDIPKFQKAGAIRVAAPALADARKFAGAVASRQSGPAVVCFFWYASMSLSGPKTGAATHYGPGLNVGTLPELEVPKEAISETEWISLRDSGP